ncbi:restriction endonuclease subunit S [Methanoculleus sp. UBA413]|uniref:restriction endonuclease subunit S n=1 Tax=Methanoculleus sp. UBA413 TaxID=1915509 RepID=UPI00257A6F4B|nr:restriction endonuclease subunit S [Methanoculleus sp. UBA413]
MRWKGLPETWESRALGEVADITMGQSPPGSSYNQISDGCPFLQGNAEFGVESPTPSYWTTEPRKMARKGSVLFSVRAPIGAVNIANTDYCIGRGLSSVSLHRGDNKYLYYLLRYLKPSIEQKGTGSTFKSITKTTLEDLVVPLPPLDTQRKIVAILDKAEATQRLRAEADALMQNLLQSVFDEMFGDPISNPKGWPRVTLEDLSLEIVDCPHSTPKYTEDCTLYPCIRTTELKDGFIDWSVMKYVEDQEYKERTKRLVPKEGDVIYGREGSFGVAVRVPKGVNICLGQRTMLFRPNLELCESEFLWALINSKGLYQQALKKTSGSTVGHINVKDVKQFVGFRPPLQLQKTFTDIVKKIDETMSYQKSSDRSISVLLESINAKAFTGDLVA